MSLHPQLVEYLARSVIAELRRQNLLRITDDRQIIELVEHVIEESQEEVARLDDEVRDILNRHYQEMRQGGLNYDEMFRKVKAQLAREKGIKI